MTTTMTTKTFDQLFSVDKNDKVIVWNIKVVNCGDHSQIITTHGQMHGKQIQHVVTVNKGKNIGKKNETTHFVQAVFEAQSKWQKKIDKGCTTTPPSNDSTNIPTNTPSHTGTVTLFPSSVTLFPMLAQDYKKHSHKLSFPCFIQPKLDGYRMIWNPSTKKGSTRSGKPYSNTDTPLFTELKSGDWSFPLDGELYVHDPNFKFEQFGVLRKTKNFTSTDLQNLNKIEYHVYDVIDPTTPFNKRFHLLESLLPSSCVKIKLVPTYLCKDENDINAFHQQFCTDGYEGSILRNANGMYKCKYRSYDLLKKKDFDDAEFTISGFTSEKDTSKENEPLIVWICTTTSGETFNVRPKGTEAERKTLFKNPDKYINQKLWVKFFGFTEGNVPRFPTTARDSVTDYIRNSVE